MKLCVQSDLGSGYIVLDGDPAHIPQRGTAPQFSADICCGQMAGWIKMPLGTEVCLGPGYCVLDGDPAPPPQKGDGAPQFLAHVCGQSAGWIKMAFGMEVGLGPGDIVLDGYPVPPKKGAQPPLPQIFGPCLLWPNGCMYHYATWCGGRPQPSRHCVRWGPSSLSLKGAQPFNFLPMFIVAKWLNRLRCHLVWR